MSKSSSSYQVFARKYRPRTFDDVLGQDHVVTTLKNAIAQNRLAHAYLFVGPRGTGKTSTARILAKALNCSGGPRYDFDPDEPLCREIAEGNSLDVLEIDGASNNGVEQVRELRETVQFAPACGQFKIYYIDEVHMLSTQAFNALLKTLEEPPAHVKFIFATTEPQKILPTIISRCQRFDLRRIPANVIAGHLLHIAAEEKLDLSEPAAHAIARGADGGMRDAQSMLDQLVAFCGTTIAESDVLEIFGFNSAESIGGIAGFVLERNTAGVLEQIHSLSEAGKDLGILLADLITHFRHLLVTKVDPGNTSGEISPELREILNGQQGLLETERLLHAIDLLAETDARMKWAPNKKLHLEIGLIKTIQSLAETSLDDVIALISDAAASGGGAPAAATPAPRPASRAAKPPAPAPSKKAASPSPAPRECAPAPAPPETPAPAPAGNLRGVELWETASRDLIAMRPLLETWLGAASLLEHNDHSLILGFPVDQSLYCEGLTRHKDAITEAVSRFAGKAMEVRLELSRDLEAQPSPAPPAEEGEPASAEAPGAFPEPGAAAPSPERPGDAASAEPEKKSAETKPEPEKDPLIQKALEEFKATIIDS